MKPGDVVHHIRTAQRLFVEGVEGRCVFVAWYTADGEIHRKAYAAAWLVENGTALA